jgi:hypothetical protein
VIRSIPVTAVEGNISADSAYWEIRHAGGSTDVSLTEHLKEGYRLLDARCWTSADYWTWQQVVSTRVGTTISFEAFPGDHPSGEYECYFFHEQTSVLPATDVGGSPPAAGKDPWGVAWLLATAGIAGALALTSRRFARRGS